MTTIIELITFPGPGMLPIWMANEKGFFMDPALRVNVTPTPRSA